MFLPILCITPTHTREYGAYSTKKHLYYSEGTFWIGACRQYNVQPHLIGLRNRFCGFTEAILISFGAHKNVVQLREVSRINYIRALHALKEPHLEVPSQIVSDLINERDLYGQATLIRV